MRVMTSLPINCVLFLSVLWHQPCSAQEETSVNDSLFIYDGEVVKLELTENLPMTIVLTGSDTWYFPISGHEATSVDGAWLQGYPEQFLSKHTLSITYVNKTFFSVNRNAVLEKLHLQLEIITNHQQRCTEDVANICLRNK